MKIATFWLDDCAFGIDASAVHDFSVPGEMRKIPQNTAQHFNRVTQLADGHFAHVINTEKLLGMAEKGPTDSTRLLVVKPDLPDSSNQIGPTGPIGQKDQQTSGPYIGLLVERMGTVLEIADSETLEHLPISHIDKKLLAGVVASGQQVIVMFNMPAILERLKTGA